MAWQRDGEGDCAPCGDNLHHGVLDLWASPLLHLLGQSHLIGNIMTLLLLNKSRTEILFQKLCINIYILRGIDVMSTKHITIIFSLRVPIKIYECIVIKLQP